MDFAFFDETGQKIFDELSKDPDNANWVNEIRQHYDDNESYPEDLSKVLMDRLVKLMKTDKDTIIENLRTIITNETDNIDYFYDQIFQTQESQLEVVEEEEEEAIDDVELIIQDDQPDEFNESALSPEEYFEYHIQKLATELAISTDLSYIIHNHFFWDYEAIIDFWFNHEKDKQDLFKKFRLIEKNGHLHNLKDPLRMKRTDHGKCAICSSDENLYELYCGHVFCKECLVEEIETLVKDNNLPVCRCEIDDGNGTKSLCEAELMPSDVKSLLDDSSFSLYQRVFLNKEIGHNKNVRPCPNPFCNWIITPMNRLPCNVGRCYNCNAVTCLLTNHDSHAPLRKCELVDKFKIEIAEEMKQLEQDQDAWIAREIRLKDYRHKYPNEVQRALDKEIHDLENKLEQERLNDVKRIKQID